MPLAKTDAVQTEGGRNKWGGVTDSNYTKMGWQIQYVIVWSEIFWNGGMWLVKPREGGRAAHGTGGVWGSIYCPGAVTGRLFLGGRCNWELGRRTQRRGGVDPLRDVRPTAYSAPEGKVGARTRVRATGRAEGRTRLNHALCPTASCQISPKSTRIDPHDRHATGKTPFPQFLIPVPCPSPHCSDR